MSIDHSMGTISRDTLAGTGANNLPGSPYDCNSTGNPTSISRFHFLSLCSKFTLLLYTQSKLPRASSTDLSPAATQQRLRNGTRRSTRRALLSMLSPVLFEVLPCIATRSTTSVQRRQVWLQHLGCDLTRSEPFCRSVLCNQRSASSCVNPGNAAPNGNLWLGKSCKQHLVNLHPLKEAIL